MRLPGWTFLVGIVVLVMATALCSVGAFVGARQFAVDLGEGGVVDIAGVGGFGEFLNRQPTPTASPTAAPTNTLVPGVTPSPTIPVPTATVDPLAQYEWQDPRRINILLMGIDQRRGETGNFRTDTMMIASIDPVRNTAGLLSIPRDLWVDIPGYRPYRINQANFLGDQGGYPGGGPALAARTVTENIGIRIEKYIVVNFDAFETVVNLVAPRGVEVCPPNPIDDPDYPDAGYGIIPVYFPPGCQRLRAVQLLQYARTRATEGGDFDRANRQQEVLQSLRDEVLSAGGILNFLGVAPQLWSQISDSYRTNLTFEEIVSLAVLAQDIPRENIRTGVIGVQQTRPANTPEGDQVLVPVYAAMRGLLEEVFGTQPITPAGGLSTADLRALAGEENARIVVFNNTTLPGLAGQTSEFLASRQITITETGNMPTPDNQPTMIRDYTGKPNTARYLAQVLGIPEDRIQTAFDGLTTADVMVVAGSDLQPLLRGETTP